MQLKTYLFMFIGLSLTLVRGFSQDVISFYNPSFEDTPRHSKVVKGWNDCGFMNESPPDVQPGSWEVSLRAQDGQTYLGMVTRDNDTWERVSQRLPKAIQGDKCYMVSVYMAAFENYVSASKLTGRISNYNAPTVLRLWGGNDPCDQGQLLAESTPVRHSDWQKYTFKLEPNADYQYIMLEAFYDVPVLIPTNGNILLDKLSDLVEIPCDDSLIAIAEKPDEDPIDLDTAVEETRNTQAIIVEEKEERNASEQAKKTPIIKELDHEKIEEGQMIRIENLYFATDSSNITKESIPVLTEIYEFLQEHQDITIEIGGHTNNLPPQFYCQQLSERRAKAVADYLFGKGISRDRVTFKGYGKSKPVVSNATKEGREKNQRCEIKILSVGK